MKISRIVATGAASLLIGASALAATGAAQAADIDAPAAPFPTETSPYASAWFTGGGSSGSSSSDGVYGLNIVSTAPGTYQVLNGTPVTGDLTDLVSEASLYVTRGIASFQIPVFGEPNATNGAGNPKGFTTLRPNAPSTPGNSTFSATAVWTTTQAIAGTPGYAANSTATLAEFEAALNQGEPLQILAVGVSVGSSGQSGSVSKLTFNGTTHLFRGALTGTQSATSVTKAQLASPGITFKASNLVPGEPVVIAGSSDNGAGVISQDELTADADGNVSYTLTADAADLGTNNIFITGEYSNASVAFAFSVTSAAALAATGTEGTVTLVAGGVLLAAGAALGLLAVRRRAALNN